MRLDARRRRRPAWLPQPTILFDGARLDRRTEVDLAGDARFLAVETLIFGRAAMGEDVHRGLCRDAWRVRRDGALVFADSLRLDGAIAATLDRPARARWRPRRGHVLYVAPDAAARLERGAGAAAKEPRARRAPAAGTACWWCAPVPRDGRTLQRDLGPLPDPARRPLPRVWQC